MRIRTYRPGDAPILFSMQQTAARFDGLVPLPAAAFAQILERAIRRAGYNVFLLTDDDDELNTWGQGETLEGLEGEVIGYAILHVLQDQRAYRIFCCGTVVPEHRQRGAGHALVLCALNHARMQALDLLPRARQEGLAVYFEIAFPAGDASAERLAQMFELEQVPGEHEPGLVLYRTEL
ncbi:MAG TPA: GNAT family N-acetyltransferase [Ktedonobacteraceae bacterium]|jgi:GNAT superfamily N-acetyltransferase